jgi:hypothetical protein
MPGASSAFETGEEVNREKNGSSFCAWPFQDGSLSETLECRVL